jgi:hypothetical protein
VTIVTVYDTEYEAFYNLSAVQVDPHRGRGSFVTVVWCLDEACELDGQAWSETHAHYEDARAAGLAHCREKHVRITGW